MGAQQEATELAIVMTTDQLILFALLLFVFVFLIWGRWRYDVVASPTFRRAGWVARGYSFFVHCPLPSPIQIPQFRLEKRLP